MKKKQLKEIHISEIIAKKGIWCDNAGNYKDEYKYYEWLHNHNSESYIPLTGADYFLETIRNRIEVCKLLSKEKVQKEYMGALSVLSADFAILLKKINRMGE